MKRGTFEISFGVIFSIMIIIFLIATAIFGIRHFLNLNRCAQVSLFFQEIQEEVNRAWQSDLYSRDYVGKLPASGILKSGVRNVCFGSLNSQGRMTARERRIKDELLNLYSANPDNNIFIYPPDKACGLEFFSRNLSHVNISNFFCKNVTREGKLETIYIRKDFNEALVRILQLTVAMKIKCRKT